MNITTIITTILGCAGGILTGILAYIKFFAERKDRRQTEIFEAILMKHLDPVKIDLKEARGEIQSLKNENHEIRLDTTRTQLLMLMQHQPSNHDTILKVAERYFCHLGGDWYMSVEFQSWADSQKINIPTTISQAIADNDRKK